jgi:hypothetical protein
MDSSIFKVGEEGRGSKWTASSVVAAVTSFTSRQNVQPEQLAILFILFLSMMQRRAAVCAPSCQPQDRRSFNVCDLQLNRIQFESRLGTEYNDWVLSSSLQAREVQIAVRDKKQSSHSHPHTFRCSGFVIIGPSLIWLAHTDEENTAVAN